MPCCRAWSHGNPIDIVGDANAARYRAALEAVLEDHDVDAVLVLNCPTAMQSPSEAAIAVIGTVVAKCGPFSGRNVFTNWIGDHSAAPARKLVAVACIPSYETPDAAICGFMNRVDYRRNQELLLETVSSHSEGMAYDRAGAATVLSGALNAAREWLDSQEISALFAGYGIPLIASRIARDPEEAAIIAASIAKPVAIKISLSRYHPQKRRRRSCP